MRLSIPLKPISVNVCWRGRRYATPEYKKWVIDMLRSMPKQEMIKGYTSLSIVLHLASLARGDIDNFCKPIIDCLVKRGWIEDDRYIQHLEVAKTKDIKEFIEVEIKELGKE